MAKKTITQYRAENAALRRENKRLTGIIDRIFEHLDTGVEIMNRIVLLLEGRGGRIRNGTGPEVEKEEKQREDEFK